MHPRMNEKKIFDEKNVPQEEDFWWKNLPARFSYKTKCIAGKTYQTQCAAGKIFCLNFDG